MDVEARRWLEQSVQNNYYTTGEPKHAGHKHYREVDNNLVGKEVGKTAHPGTGPNARTCRLLGSPLRWARAREEGGGRAPVHNTAKRWVQAVG